MTNNAEVLTIGTRVYVENTIGVVWEIKTVRKIKYSIRTLRGDILPRWFDRAELKVTGA